MQEDVVCKSVCQRLALLRGNKPFIDMQTILIFGNGRILTTYYYIFIDYCCVVWGTCSHSDLHRLTRLQKTAAIIILNAGYNQSLHEWDVHRSLWYPFSLPKINWWKTNFTCQGAEPIIIRNDFLFSCLRVESTTNVDTKCTIFKTFWKPNISIR